MCGIVGIYLKNKELYSQLGRLFSPMLREMGIEDQIVLVLQSIEITSIKTLKLRCIHQLKILIGQKLRNQFLTILN